jgi:hypothetical protein
MSKTAAIEFLKEQLAASEHERKKIEALIARLPQIEAEIQATKLVLAKHTGSMQQISLPSQTRPSAHPADAVSSVSRLTVQALTEAGKPQTTAQLLGFLASHGKQTTSATLRSTIWLLANKGRLFRVIHPGLYGLVGWEDSRR